MLAATRCMKLETVSGAASKGLIAGGLTTLEARGLETGQAGALVPFLERSASCLTKLDLRCAWLLLHEEESEHGGAQKPSAAAMKGSHVLWPGHRRLSNPHCPPGSLLQLAGYARGEMGAGE